jgi:hypothetical protein
MTNTRKVGNYTLVINDTIHKVPVRLVGIIDEDDCEAILNTKDAAQKISTAKGLDAVASSFIGRRFVVVLKSPTKCFGNVESPAIYISPKIDIARFNNGLKTVHCIEHGVPISFTFDEVNVQ